MENTIWCIYILCDLYYYLAINIRKKTTLIVSNIVDGRTLEKGYVIANGLKININDDSQYLLKQIMQYEPISLCNLLQVTDNSISNDVRLAIAKMAQLDIIELIL